MISSSILFLTCETAAGASPEPSPRLSQQYLSLVLCHVQYLNYVQ